MPDPTIEAHAARLAQERGSQHLHCPNGDVWEVGDPIDDERGLCTDDHRSPASRKAAAMDAAAVLWAYGATLPNVLDGDMVRTFARTSYDTIQRTEVPQ